MDQVWWNRVPNAIAFTADITQNLLDEKSVILHCEQSIPWYETMVLQVKESVTQQDSSKRFEVIRHVDDPGPYLLQEFCKPEKRATYRPTKGYARFFAESDDIVLHSRYYWVFPDSTETLESWVDFVSDYYKNRGKNKETAVFILEWRGEKANISRKGIRTISFDDYINEYDRTVFAMLASSEIKEKSEIKNYAAELTVSISGNDIELCAACLIRYKHFLESPHTVLREITDTKYQSDGTPFSYRATIEDVSKCIWKAQIKTIYPLLESYRGAFVDKYARVIEKELPITSSYGEIYDDPKDVELGTLVFMADNGRLILNTAEYKRLKRFKDARNKLSHLDILTIGEIRGLLE